AYSDYHSIEAGCRCKLAIGDASAGDNFATDQPTTDFAGARTNLVELGIAQKPASRILIRITVAAEQLDRVERNLRRPLGGEKDAAGRILACRLAAITGRRHRVAVGAGRI